MTASPFLLDNFAPVPDEAGVSALPVEGVLPAALDGLYVRTGPNPLGAPPEPYHWFTGTGMVHGVRLRGGRAEWYRNRWVRTDPVADTLGEPRRPGPAQPLYDISNTNVVPFAGRLLSLTEGCYPYVLTDDLDTTARWAVDGTLPHGLTAHPKVDPVTGDLHGFAYWWDQPYLLYHMIDPAGRVTVSEPIELPAPVSMHDFAITERFVVFFDQPAVFDLEALAITGFPFAWKPDNGARIGLLPRDGSGPIEWYDTDLCYCFHPLNAYDEADGSVVVDVPRMPSVFTTPSPLGADLRLERWVVDRTAGKVGSDVVDDTPQEFCRVDARVLGRRHRFGYTIGSAGERPYDDTRVVKHDFVAGARHVHDFGTGRHPGEFLFVPDPDRAADEDGGWLLGFVHDGATTLSVLDAQDVEGPPVAEVRIPRRVPYGFHGAWSGS
ncbi:MAG TPA: carotenoid oxygenase family protein [Acidimicrobiales bacterium]|nr:carotenoid oxygenase family protein [Acidimicrobiales bacterium]